MSSDKTTTMAEVEFVQSRIIRAFEHIPDPEYRKIIAGCWARSAIEACKEFHRANAT